MADIAQILATGGTTIVGVGVGAGLTYWFGALNRRHQEAREDATRWHEARLKEFLAFTQTAFRAGEILSEGWSTEEGQRIVDEFVSSFSALMLLSSREVISAGRDVLALYTSTLQGDEAYDEQRITAAMTKFRHAARKDLGHPSP